MERQPSTPMSLDKQDSSSSFDKLSESTDSIIDSSAQMNLAAKFLKLPRTSPMDQANSELVNKHMAFDLYMRSTRQAILS